MDLPAQVLLHNEVLGLKGGKGTLIAVDARGFYEVKISFGEKIHRVLLPIAESVVIFREPEPQYVIESEIER